MTNERSTGAWPRAVASVDDALIAEAAALGLVSRQEVREDSVRIQPPAAGVGVRALLVREHVLGYAKLRFDAALDEHAMATRLAALDLGPRSHGDLQTLWTSALPGSPLDRLDGSAADLADVAQAWGRAVAQLHAEPINRSARSAPRPWVLGFELRPPDRGSRLSTAELTVLRTAASDPVLRRAARQADDRWTESSLIHGDLSAAHVIVQRQPRLRARFVGLRRAGAGDPSWDLACAVETIARHAPQWRMSERVLVDSFLRGYRRGNGPGRLDPELRALRAIEIAWQVAADDGADQVRHWLARARSHAAHATRFGWAA